MCGIVGGVGEPDARGLTAILHRGPDADAIQRAGNFWLGHSRLAIVGLGSAGDQPFTYGATVVSYNGELWNHLDVRAELEALGLEFKTACDTEVVAAALDAWGEEALPRFRGMFAVAWVTDGVLRVARDRFGEVPAHVSVQKPFRFASEIRPLLDMGAHPASIRWVEPGTLYEVTPAGFAVRRWHRQSCGERAWTRPLAASAILGHLTDSADDRSMADVPTCTLLSGGTDSGACAALLQPRVGGALVAYTAVYDRKSSDLRRARQQAERLGLDLVEVSVAAPSADDLARVIGVIEMPHKAQIEIGWACLKLAERIQGDGFKVVYSGEGSDELWGSYNSTFHAVVTGRKDWCRYRRDMFIGQHRKNFARCNKIFMRRGIECRLPFLHPALVDDALSMSVGVVQNSYDPGRRKVVLRDAVRALVTPEVASSPRASFQDGAGLKRAVTLKDPLRYYRAEFRGKFRGVKP